MEVPRLGVQSEWQMLAYATGTATWDLTCICDLQHSSRQRRILNLPREARDGTRLLMDPSQAEPRRELPRWIYKRMLRVYVSKDTMSHFAP